MIIEEKKKLFNQIELDLDLFSYEIKGVKIWQFIRRSIFDKILVKSKIVDKAQDEIDRGLFKMFYYFLRSLKYIFTNKDALFFLKKEKEKDVLIINHPRKKKIGNQFASIFTDFLLKDSNLNYQILEHFSVVRRSTKNEMSTRYIDFIIGLGYIFKKIDFLHLRKSDVLKIKYLNDYFFNIFKIDLELHKEIRNMLKFRKIYSYFFNKLLNVYNPKLIIEVVSYDPIKMIFNELCKKKKIRTVEFQHGLLNHLDLGYDFPENVNIEVFPDYFFSYGTYWENSVHLPIKKKKIKTVGFPYLENEYNKYKNANKSDKILFISAGNFGKELSKFANNFTEISGKKIIFKLHPGEYNRWKSQYVDLKSSNITVIDNDDISLYNYFAECNCVVGVYSTALYESFIFNNPLFIVKIPGYEYMRDVLNNDLATLVTTPEGLIHEIENLNKKKIEINSSQFFHKNAIQNQKDAIDKILKM